MRNFILILNILIFEKTRYYNTVQSLYSHSVSFDTRCERVRTLSGRRQRRTSIFWNIARSSQEAGSGSWCGVCGENSESHGGEQHIGPGSVPVQCRKNNAGVKHTETCYRLGTVNSKSFVGKVLLRIKWKFELN